VLCYGDNLSILRESIRAASADPIYLGPPFNSNPGVRPSLHYSYKASNGDGVTYQRTHPVKTAEMVVHRARTYQPPPERLDRQRP
jgi:hypothetical protein